MEVPDLRLLWSHISLWCFVCALLPSADSYTSVSTCCAVHSGVSVLSLQHDLVPRTCVASLAQLRQELELQTEAVFANNATMGWLRDSGVLAGGKALVASLCTYSAAGAVSPPLLAGCLRTWGLRGLMGQ